MPAPSAKPTSKPTTKPSSTPTASPSSDPTANPTLESTNTPRNGMTWRTIYYGDNYVTKVVCDIGVQCNP
jgi:hypothetical protein